jgi:hypothetical protein
MAPRENTLAQCSHRALTELVGNNTNSARSWTNQSFCRQMSAFSWKMLV